MKTATTIRCALLAGHGRGHPLLSDQQRGAGPVEEVLRRPPHRLQQEPAIHGHDAIYST